MLLFSRHIYQFRIKILFLLLGKFICCTEYKLLFFSLFGIQKIVWYITEKNLPIYRFLVVELASSLLKKNKNKKKRGTFYK